eukprot:scaffold572906_cov30-Prasinocladus_malaysianus.AAC.1
MLSWAVRCTPARRLVLVSVWRTYDGRRYTVSRRRRQAGPSNWLKRRPVPRLLTTLKHKSNVAFTEAFLAGEW